MAKYAHAKKIRKEMTSLYKKGVSGVVIGACPGAGKTNLTIDFLESDIDLEGKKVLILAHGQKELRKQFTNRFKSTGSSLKVKEIHSKEDAKRSKAQIHISLPHAVKGLEEAIYDIVVVDEAHEFYFATMVQRIIKTHKPEFQVLLTGTPFEFTRRKLFPVLYFSLLELYDNNCASDLSTLMVCAKSDIKKADYNSNYDISRKAKTKKQETLQQLNESLIEITNKLLISSDSDEFESVIGESASWCGVFEYFEKSLIVCRSQEQAKQVNSYFRKIGVNCSVSTSDTDKESKEFESFKKDKNQNVLIVVRRGILGFDFPEMRFCLDLSLSMNISRVFQLYTRLVRVHPEGKSKYFMRVAASSVMQDAYALMNFTLALADKRWYETYNGGGKTELRNVQFPVLKRSRTDIEAILTAPSQRSENKEITVDNCGTIRIKSDAKSAKKSSEPKKKLTKKQELSQIMDILGGKRSVRKSSSTTKIKSITTSKVNSLKVNELPSLSILKGRGGDSKDKVVMATLGEVKRYLSSKESVRKVEVLKRKQLESELKSFKSDVQWLLTPFYERYGFLPISKNIDYSPCVKEAIDNEDNTSFSAFCSHVQELLNGIFNPQEEISQYFEDAFSLNEKKKKILRQSFGEICNDITFDVEEINIIRAIERFEHQYGGSVFLPKKKCNLPSLKLGLESAAKNLRHREENLELSKHGQKEIKTTGISLLASENELEILNTLSEIQMSHLGLTWAKKQHNQELAS